MIGCLRTRVRKQPIIALYFEFEIVLKFYNLEPWSHAYQNNVWGNKEHYKIPSEQLDQWCNTMVHLHHPGHDSNSVHQSLTVVMETERPCYVRGVAVQTMIGKSVHFQ